MIDEVASFPSGRNDDLVDCVSLALARFRSGGFIGTAMDKEYDEFTESTQGRFEAKLAQVFVDMTTFRKEVQP